MITNVSLQYIRFKNDTRIERVVDHMHSQWGLKKPHLIISITGRRKNVVISNQIKKKFQRGLVQSTKNINSWIITNGANTGISKLVGEAISEQNINNKKTKVIGILNWNTVAHRSELEVKVFFLIFLPRNDSFVKSN